MVLTNDPWNTGYIKSFLKNYVCPECTKKNHQKHKTKRGAEKFNIKQQFTTTLMCIEKGCNKVLSCV